MIKKMILFLFLAGVCVGAENKVYALSVGTTTTGVYTEYEVKDNERILDIIPFNDFSLSTKWGTITGHVGEYVSNSFGSSSASDGWVSVRGYRGEVVCQIDQLSISAGTGSTRIVGRMGNVGTGSVLYEFKTSTPASTIFPVSEKADWYRLEYNIDTIGTDSVRGRIKVTDSVR